MNNSSKIKIIRVFLSLYILITLLHILQAKIIFQNSQYPRWEIFHWINLSDSTNFNFVFWFTFVSSLLLGLGVLSNLFSFLTYLGLFTFFNYNQYIFEIHYFYLNWLLLAMVFYHQKNEKLFLKSVWFVFIFSMGLLGFAKLFYGNHYFTPRIAKYILDLETNRMHFSGVLSPLSSSLAKNLPDSILTLISFLAGSLELAILPLGLFKKTKPIAFIFGLSVFLFIGLFMNYINISIFMIFFMLVGFWHHEHQH